MNKVQIIQFTQNQVRSITGISCETLRHWRKNIPYLAEKSGKSARFSFSDVVCLAATAQAIEAFGASISSIGPMIDPLFRKLTESRPSLMQNQAVVLEGKDTIICRLDEIPQLGFSGPILLIPLAPLIETMRQSLLPGFFSESEPQMQIPFSPQTVNVNR